MYRKNENGWEADWPALIQLFVYIVVTGLMILISHFTTISEIKLAIQNNFKDIEANKKAIVELRESTCADRAMLLDHLINKK